MFDCGIISYVRLPENVERIGKNSFAGCTKLIKVDNIESVKEIDDSAFENCNMLVKKSTNTHFKPDFGTSPRGLNAS